MKIFNWLKMKGQFTIVAVIMVLITLVVYVYMYPAFWDIIEPQLESINDTGVVALVSLSPFLIAVAILLSIIWYV